VVECFAEFEKVFLRATDFLMIDRRMRSRIAGGVEWKRRMVTDFQ